MKSPVIATLALSMSFLAEYATSHRTYAMTPLTPAYWEVPAPPAPPPPPENLAAAAPRVFRAPAPVPIRKRSPRISRSIVALIDQAARRARIPEELLHSVAMVESGYRADAVSPVGAVGVMQLMPATARSVSVNPYVPEENIEGGARYLAQLLRKYRNDRNQLQKAIAAYNAGPTAVDRHNGIPPYPETQRYVAKVMQQYRRNLAAD